MEMVGKKRRKHVGLVCSGMTTKPKRGGAGRKPLSVGEKSVTVCLRMTESQRDKLKLLGGASSVRDRIEAGNNYAFLLDMR